MLPTYVCGRWNRFSSLYPETKHLRELRNDKTASVVQLSEAEDQLIILLLKQLEDCGVQVTTDGGVRWDSLYDVSRSIEGCHGFTELSRVHQSNQFHRQPVVKLPLTWVQSLLYADYAFAKQHTRLPLSFCLPGPFSTALQTKNVSDIGVQKLAEHYATVFNQELRCLLRTKEIAFVRIDEPRPPTDPQEFALFRNLMEKLVRGLDCSRLALTSYGSINSFYDYFNLPFGIFFVSFVNNDNSLAVLRDFPTNKKLVAGIVETRQTCSENPRDLLRIIENISSYIPDNCLALAGNSDWHFLPWDRAVAKLKKLVEVARHV